MRENPDVDEEKDISVDENEGREIGRDEFNKYTME